MGCSAGSNSRSCGRWWSNGPVPTPPRSKSPITAASSAGSEFRRSISTPCLFSNASGIPALPRSTINPPSANRNPRSPSVVTVAFAPCCRTKSESPVACPPVASISMISRRPGTLKTPGSACNDEASLAAISRSAESELPERDERSMRSSYGNLYEPIPPHTESGPYN